jgi:hypothetical protein
MIQLFISYAHESIAKVRPTVEVLTAGGDTTWFDEQLLPGQDWKQALGDAIARCDAFVYAITSEAVASEWCDWELATAVRLKKAVIPVLLEPDISVPDSLKGLQYADFSQGMTPIEVAKLTRALAVMQKIPVSESPSLPADPKGIPSRAWESGKHWTDTVITPVYQPQNESEEIIGKFGASLCLGIVKMGGRITLTNQRVLFEPNKMTPQSTALAIPLSAIESVVPSNSLGIVPDCIIIRCHSGEKHRFYVWGRKRIISMLQECRSRVQAVS